MYRISQRLALLCGGLCLALGLVLVLVSSLSSRYILKQQSTAHLQALAGQLAVQIGPVVATGDLVRLEATLRTLRQRHGLQQIAVSDLDARPLGQSGDALTSESQRFAAAVEIDGNIAGELSLARAPDPALDEQRGMSFGLLFLAVLGSLFAAALAGRWGQRVGARLGGIRETLGAAGGDGDEIEELEQAVAALPLDLLRPPERGEERTTEFEEAGLLYVNLQSLARYVETLDEHSLLEYTEAQRKLIAGAAGLYDGSLAVAREFGVLVSFSGAHPAGSPGFRAASCAWLLMQIAGDLDKHRRLSYSLGLACGLGEAAHDGRDIYPALYNQHIIDELSVRSRGDEIAVSPALAGDADIANRCRLDGEEDFRALRGFLEPHSNLLERQRHLLAREMGAAG